VRLYPEWVHPTRLVSAIVRMRCGADNSVRTGLAVERAATVYSSDNDFKRFPGLEHINPLEA